VGLSEQSGDLKEVMGAAERGDDRAVLAYGVYAYRLRTSIGAMVAAMGGIDALVFTGGAGEASSRLRSDVCAGLGFLGVAIDPPRNEQAGDRVISNVGALPAVAVVDAREDLEIERLVRQVVS
jgi:acetate kinase